MFVCNGCQAQKDDVLLSILIIKEWGKGIERFCRDCHKPNAAIPDVYFDGKPEHNLADDPNTGQPHVFFSKSQKASYLKSRGLQEAGDSVHGAPMQFHQNQDRKIDTRAEVQKALQKVKNMGQDVRRQEYYRIIKEGRR